MAKIKILLVEDEPDLRSAYKEILRDYHLIEAANGKEGLEKARAEMPRLIITDIRMPEMDGMEMVSILRKEEIFSSVIFVTGFADSLKTEDAAQLGAFDFLEKPLKPAKLLKAVKSALLLGSRSISELSSGKDVEYRDNREFVDVTIRDFPGSVLRKLQDYCMNRGLNVEQTIVQWILEKMDMEQADKKEA